MKHLGCSHEMTPVCMDMLEMRGIQHKMLRMEMKQGVYRGFVGKGILLCKQ